MSTPTATAATTALGVLFIGGTLSSSLVNVVELLLDDRLGLKPAWNESSCKEEAILAIAPYSSDASGEAGDEESSVGKCMSMGELGDKG